MFSKYNKIAPFGMLFLKNLFGEGVTRQLEVPDKVHGTPCESCAESGENQLVAFVEEVLFLVEAHGNGGGRCVAAVFDVDEHFSSALRRVRPQPR